MGNDAITSEYLTKMNYLFAKMCGTLKKEEIWEIPLCIFIIMIVLPTAYLFWHNYLWPKYKKSTTYVNLNSTLKIVITIQYISAIFYGAVSILDYLFNYKYNFADLSRLALSLFVTSCFALFYSIAVEIKNKKSFNNIYKSINGIQTQLKDLRKDAPRLFRPEDTIFDQLVNEIFSGKRFIYEGDNAINASVCLYTIANNSNAQKNQKIYTVYMILRSPALIDEENKDKGNNKDNNKINDKQKRIINDFFTTLFILYNITRPSNNSNLTFNISIFNESYDHFQYVNLTDSSIFFSPYKKFPDGRFPYTYNFNNKGTTDEFYHLFNLHMEDRIAKLKGKIDVNSEGDMLSFFNHFNFNNFAENGCFDKELKRKNRRENLTIVSDYFQEKLKNRLSTYQEHIDNCNF